MPNLDVWAIIKLIVIVIVVVLVVGLTISYFAPATNAGKTALSGTWDASTDSMPGADYNPNAGSGADPYTLRAQVAMLADGVLGVGKWAAFKGYILGGLCAFIMLGVLIKVAKIALQ